MTPNGAAATARAGPWLFPWIIALFIGKFLEFDSRKDYHYSVPCGPAKPTSFARAAVCHFQSAALALLK
jgi:hypothetical protein